MSLSLDPILIRKESLRVPILVGHQGSDEILIPRNKCCSNKSKETACKIVALVVSASAKIFFVPVSLKLPLGSVFALGNALGFTNLEYWAASKTIEKIFLVPVDNPMLPSQLHPSGEVSNITLLPAAIIAMSSKIPVALAAYNYNAPQYKILAGTVTLVSGSLFSLRSLQLSISETFARKKLTENQEKLSRVKEELKALIRENHDSFLSKSLKNRVQFILSVENIKDLPASTDKIHRYYQKMFYIQDQAPRNHSRCRKLTERCVYFTGHILNASFQTAAAMYTFVQTKKDIYDSNFLAGFLAGLTIVSDVYLMGSSINTTSIRLFNSVVNCLTGNSKPTITEEYRPKITFLLKMLGLIVDGLSLGASVVMWGEFYSSSKAAQYYFQSTFCMSIFLVLFTATLDSVDDMVELLIKHKGTKEEQSILKMSKEFREIESALDKISLKDIGLFLKKLSPDFQTKLFQKFHYTQENLHNLLEGIQDI